MEVEEIVDKLESLSNQEAIKGMARFGISPKKTFGIQIPILRKMAKESGKNHVLARKLWTRDIRETRILASMIDKPGLVTEFQMDSWTKDFDYWEICDQC